MRKQKLIIFNKDVSTALTSLAPLSNYKTDLQHLLSIIGESVEMQTHGVKMGEVDKYKLLEQVD